MLSRIEQPHIEADPATLAQAAAQRCLDLAATAIAQRGRFDIALSGGSTPAALYALLATEHAGRTDWSGWHIYFGDERCVPRDHAQSNYRMARETWLEHVAIPCDQIHPMVRHPSRPDSDARAYAQTLVRSGLRHEDTLPVFDLVLLGLGTDGHTASLFPESAILGVEDRPVAAVYVKALRSWRISLSYPAINAARHVLFLVAGAGKAGVLHAIGHDTATRTPYPVERLAPRGEIEWYLDRAAAKELSS